MKDSEIYEKLRTAHNQLKDILYDDNFDELGEGQKNAIDAVHSVLYLAEDYFVSNK